MTTLRNAIWYLVAWGDSIAGSAVRLQTSLGEGDTSPMFVVGPTK
jgi:hypothetical protein